MSPSNDKDRKIIARDRITAGGCEFSPTATIARIGLIDGDIPRHVDRVKPLKKRAAAVRKTKE
jgi:hypothetical protein